MHVDTLCTSVLGVFNAVKRGIITMATLIKKDLIGVAHLEFQRFSMLSTWWEA